MNSSTLGITQSPSFSKVSSHSHWFLRAALASVFIFHGVGKFADLGGFAAMMNLPYLAALLVAIAEVGGAVLLIAGGFGKDILTRLGALAFIPVMLGAIVMVHAPRWSFVPTDSHPMGGMEFQVVLTLIALYFVFKGNDA